MKRIAFAFCLITANCLAQSPTIEWQTFFYAGVSYTETANCVRQTPDGGYVVGGERQHSGPGGDNNGYVGKLTAAGTVQWRYEYGGSSADYINAVEPTADGGYIVVGNLGSGNAGVPVTYGSLDGWVLKLDANGTVQWQRAFGTWSVDGFSSVKPTPDGGYILGGSSQQDYWVVKIDSQGVQQWEKKLGGSSQDFGRDVQLTTDGGYIICGSTLSTDYMVTNNHGGTDGWVVKLASNGDVQWQKAFGGTTNDQFLSITPTADGGYIAVGDALSSNGDFAVTHGGFDLWVVKMDATGNLLWQKLFGGSSNETAYDIAPTQSGDFLITGCTWSQNGDVSGNHMPALGDGCDMWTLKVTPSGNLLWQRATGGTSYETSVSVIESADGGVVISGKRQSNDGDIPAGVSSGGPSYVVKLNTSLGTPDLASGSLTIYPNPAQSEIRLRLMDDSLIDRLSVYDMTGKLILRKTTDTSLMSVESLASGIYVLETVSGNKTIQSKFVKQ